jgi:hypothetical protein
MGGVDAWDSVCFNSSIARKCSKWPVRVIEHTVTFLATNSKTAYCLYTGKPVANYTNKKYYLDVLRGVYDRVETLSKIQLEIKPNLPKKRVCVWDKCTKTSKILCYNQHCKKYGCINHLLIICDGCFFDDTIKNSNVTRTNLKDKIQKKCFLIGCSKNSTLACACCSKKICRDHRYYLCIDCSGLHSNSDSQSVFSHKFKAKKPRISLSI